MAQVTITQEDGRRLRVIFPGEEPVILHADSVRRTNRANNSTIYGTDQGYLEFGNDGTADIRFYDEEGALRRIMSNSTAAQRQTARDEFQTAYNAMTTPSQAGGRRRKRKTRRRRTNRRKV
jgi:hypothetical protein